MSASPQHNPGGYKCMEMHDRTKQAAASCVAAQDASVVPQLFDERVRVRVAHVRPESPGDVICAAEPQGGISVVITVVKTPPRLRNLELARTTPTGGWGCRGVDTNGHEFAGGRSTRLMHSASWVAWCLVMAAKLLVAGRCRGAASCTPALVPSLELHTHS
jgi:hypothetical protein